MGQIPEIYEFHKLIADETLQLCVRHPGVEILSFRGLRLIVKVVPSTFWMGTPPARFLRR